LARERACRSSPRGGSGGVGSSAGLAAASLDPIPILACPATRSTRGVHRRASPRLANTPLHPLEGEGISSSRDAATTTVSISILAFPLEGKAPCAGATR